MEPFPLSLLNDFLYCPRRAALKGIEGVRRENIHTVLGDLAHEHADLPGYEVAKGVKLLRALPVWSDRLGLSGKCDIVEIEAASADDLSPLANDRLQMTHDRLPEMNEKLRMTNGKAIRPVEYKKGKKRQFENDDVQLCAQALCLEEMFGVPIVSGAVFHAASKRRREVPFTPELRARTEQAVADLRALLDGGILPHAVKRDACEECSLFEVCLPELSSSPDRCARAAQNLFST